MTDDIDEKAEVDGEYPSAPIAGHRSSVVLSTFYSEGGVGVNTPRNSTAHYQSESEQEGESGEDSEWDSENEEDSATNQTKEISNNTDIA